MVAILRLNAEGVVIAANHDAVAFLGPCIGRRCCDVVLARGSDRLLLCGTSCAAGLCGPRALLDLRGVVVRGLPVRMICSNSGDERVVVLLGGQRATPVGHLSPRERAVLALAAAGRSDVQMAEALGVQPSTIKTHLTRARTKLGASTRAEAVARALRAGLIA